MDAIDTKILTLLQEDTSISIAELAAEGRAVSDPVLEAHSTP